MSYTDYTYQVQVRIDSDSGEMTVFVTSEGGEIGKPIHGGTDFDIAHSLGRILLEEARREEHGWGPEETLEDYAVSHPDGTVRPYVAGDLEADRAQGYSYYVDPAYVERIIHGGAEQFETLACGHTVTLASDGGEGVCPCIEHAPE